MANLTLSRDEEGTVERVLQQFDPAEHPLARSYIEELENPEERHFIIDFLRGSLKRRLLSAFLLDAAYNVLIENDEENHARQVKKDAILDELSFSDSMRPPVLPNGKLSPSTRRYIGDFLNSFSYGQFTANQILQQVNQGKGREAGECQDRFLSLADLAILETFPQWAQWQAERHIEDALTEEEVND